MPKVNGCAPTASDRQPVFLDGSNLILGVVPGGSPSVYSFACLFEALSSKGYEVGAVFDYSIRYHLKKRGVPGEWDALDRLRAASSGAIGMARYADAPLLTAANAANGYVVSHADIYLDWTSSSASRPKLILVSCVNDMLTFHFPDEEPKSFSVRLPDSVTLFGQRFVVPPRSQAKAPSESDDLKGAYAMEILSSSDQTSHSMEARLIVFALDASGSMWSDEYGARETYDKRRKGEHLTEVLRDTFERFKTSTVSKSF